MSIVLITSHPCISLNHREEKEITPNNEIKQFKRRTQPQVIDSNSSKNINSKWSPTPRTDPFATSKAVATLHSPYLLPSHHRLYLPSQQKSEVANNGEPKSSD
jgi:hypothetical protein